MHLPNPARRAADNSHNVDAPRSSAIEYTIQIIDSSDEEDVKPILKTEAVEAVDQNNRHGNNQHNTPSGSNQLATPGEKTGPTER